MADRDRRPSHDHDYFDEYGHHGYRGGLTPGKSTMTSMLPARSQTNIIFRVANAEAARALVDGIGSPGANDGGSAEAQVARAQSTSGKPLPSGVRERFEGSVQADLSAVRVHTGAESANAAAAVGARSLSRARLTMKPKSSGP